MRQMLNTTAKAVRKIRISRQSLQTWIMKAEVAAPPMVDGNVKLWTEEDISKLKKVIARKAGRAGAILSAPTKSLHNGIGNPKTHSRKTRVGHPPRFYTFSKIIERGAFSTVGETRLLVSRELSWAANTSSDVVYNHYVIRFELVTACRRALDQPCFRTSFALPVNLHHSKTAGPKKDSSSQLLQGTDEPT
jgi:hypothetical protein